ncbi:hypothetical protein ACFE04_009624 [Oxalis oulophora]
MGSQGNDNHDNGKQSHQHQPPLTRQNSLYSLTLDEVGNKLGDLGKPLGSLNLDELLNNVWGVEANNQSISMEAEGTLIANQTALQRQGSLSLTGALSKKTVDEVWKDIQHSKVNGETKPHDRKTTMGEMTLEDFLVQAGVVAEPIKTDPVVEIAQSVEPQFSQQGQWSQYPPQVQYQTPPPQSMMGVYMPGHHQPVPIMDVTYPGESQMALTSPLMGTLSDTATPGRKRGCTDYAIEKSVERRQKRMIKNRESAARSRARKQAYTTELENKISRLEEENERLKTQMELEKMLPTEPPPEPTKYQLRRTSSAPF